MAAVASLATYNLGVLEVLAASDTVTVLESDYSYQLFHSGYNTLGVADTVPVVVSVNTDTTDTGFDGGTNKYILTPGTSPVIIGPGCHSIVYRATGLGTPVLTISRCARWLGAY